MSGAAPDIGIYVDFRNPPRWPREDADVYAENIELVQLAESLGFRYVWLSEHHFSSDGYAPSPLVLAAALAAATSTIRIGTAVAVLPLYHPIRFAEDAALVDVLSSGRLELGVGTGWRPEEFEAYGVPLAERGMRTDSALQVLSALWAGEPAGGGAGPMAPRPVQAPRPRLWVGGSSRAALRRAARFGDGIVVSDVTPEMAEAYRAELTEAGRDRTTGLIANNLRWFMASHDPEATFAAAAPHVAAWYDHYAAWMAGVGGPFTTVAGEADLRDRGLLTVVTPVEAAKAIRDLHAAVPCTCISIKARPPGMSFDAAAEHLELFAHDVLPRLG